MTDRLTDEQLDQMLHDDDYGTDLNNLVAEVREHRATIAGLTTALENERALVRGMIEGPRLTGELVEGLTAEVEKHRATIERVRALCDYSIERDQYRIEARRVLGLLDTDQ